MATCSTFKSMPTIAALLGLGLCAWGCKAIETRVPPTAIAQPAPQPREKSADELFAEGLAAFQAGRDEQARALFARALERAPGMINAQYNLGVIAERQGDLGQAAKAYETALLIDRSHAPSILNLGRVYLWSGELDRAIELFESGLRQPAGDYELSLLNNLAAAYRLAKWYAKAQEASRSVLAKHPDDLEALRNLALAYHDQGRYRLAELIGISALKINAQDPGIHNDLGLAYLNLGQRTRALAEFREALALDPKFAPAHRNLGALALSYRDYPTAEKSFAHLVAIEPHSYQAHLDYAYALQGQLAKEPGKALAAAVEFEKALAIRPSNPDAICGAGWAYSYDEANRRKAAEYLEKCKSSPATSERDRLEIEARQESMAALLRASSSGDGAPVRRPDMAGEQRQGNEVPTRGATP